MARFFEGLRVLDLTNVLAGPFCGYQLALQGAEVIKVEVPGSGDLARQLGADPALNARMMGASFLAQNAGKKSITINLKHASGKALFQRLVKTTDVVLENFRPGVMDRLGLGYKALSELNPRLVYCAISGFGQTGPMRDTRAYDQIIQGLSGVMSVTGDPTSGPTRAGFPVCDIVGGLTAAYAISGALHRRATVGKGDFLDVSMLDASITMLGWAASNWLIAGVEPQLLGNDNMTSAPSGAFKTGDGLLNIAANEQGQFVALCGLIGQPEIATDPRFAKRDARKRNRKALNELIETHLMARPAIEWEQLCNDAGVPAGRILSVPDALKNPQIVHREMTRDFTQVPGVDRPITVVAAGFKAVSNDEPVLAPPPGLGQHTDEVLGQLGLSAAEISTLHAEGAI